MEFELESSISGVFAVVVVVTIVVVVVAVTVVAVASCCWDATIHFHSTGCSLAPIQATERLVARSCANERRFELCHRTLFAHLADCAEL